MIQYRYQRSEGSGFGSYISETDPNKAEVYNSVFNQLSAIVNLKEICFTYLVEGGMAYFMQTEVQTNANSHGIAGATSNLPDIYPVEYLNKIGASYVKDIKLPLKDENFPADKNRLILNVARELKPVFAEIVDTLLYTDKKIILIARDGKILQNYMFVISLLLPKNYMRHVGFVYNVETMPYILSSGDSLANSIRIIATKSTSLASFGGDDYYVVDVTGDKPVLPEIQLHSYGRLIKFFEDDLKRGSVNIISGIINDLRDAFGIDGKIDYDKIDIKTIITFYERETTSQNAKALLKARLMLGGKDIIPIDDIVNAMISFIGEGSADKETTGYINQIIDEDTNIGKIITVTIGKDTLLKINKSDKVTQEQIKYAVDYLAGEQNEEWLETFATLNERYNQKIFELLVQAYVKTKSKAILVKIADYCRVSSVRNNIDEIDNEIFGFIDKYKDDSVQLLAAVLFSAYFDPQTGNKITQKDRIERLQKYIDIKYSYNKEFEAEKQDRIKSKINFLLSLGKEIRSVYELVLGRKLPEVNDLNIVSESFIRELIEEFEFNACLEYFNANGKRIAEYILLNNVIIEKLTNIGSVEKEIKSDRQINSYKIFLKDINEEDNNINDKLKAKEEYNRVKDAIFRERSDYTIGLYKCMPLELRKDVANYAKQYMEVKGIAVDYMVERRHDGIDLRLNELRATLNEKSGDIDSLNLEWQAIIDSIHSINKEKQEKKESFLSGKDVNYTLLSLLKSFFCAVATFAILCIVPIVGAYLSQESFIDRLGEYLNTFHLIAVLWTFGFHFYLRMRAYKNSNKGGSKYGAEVKMVWYYTFLIEFLPVLLYVASYIIYSTVVPSNFSF